MTTTHGLFLVTAICALGITGTAAADAGSAQAARPRPRLSDVPDAVGTGNLPAECRAFAWVPPDAEGSPFEWNQALSLAACLQDSSIADVSDPEDLDALVEELSETLAPSMMIYLGILESGPPTVQLRAAFQVGLANVALVTRARRSLVVPKDLATNPVAASQFHDLHAALEPLLAHAKRTIQIAFTTVVRAADEEPALARDPVAQNMVRTARETLERMTDETAHDVALAR